jgi:hypothetical protein
MVTTATVALKHQVTKLLAVMTLQHPRAKKKTADLRASATHAEM